MTKTVTLQFDEEFAAFFGIDTAYECVVRSRKKSSDCLLCCACLSNVLGKNDLYIASVVLTDSSDSLSVFKIFGKFPVLETPGGKRTKTLYVTIGVGIIQS